MPEFGKRLKQLMEKSELSVYQLAQRAGVERTMIYKAMSEERIPSEEFLQKLCEALKVSPWEEQDLMEAYDIYKIGEGIYHQRKFITRILEQLSSITGKKFGAVVEEKREVTNKLTKTNEIRIYEGEFEIHRLIKKVFDVIFYGGETTYVNLFVPTRFDLLYDQLYQYCLDCPNLPKISHVLRFSDTKDGSMLNLTQLSQVLRFAFVPEAKYQPYYYYNRTDVAENIPLVLPFYLVTNQMVLAFSGDFKSAAVTFDKNLHSLYEKWFDKTLAFTRPLMKQMLQGYDILEHCLTVCEQPPATRSCMMAQPLLLNFITPSYLQEKLYLEKEAIRVLRPKLEQYFKAINDTFKDGIFIFSEEGLDAFMKTGRFILLPNRIARPAAPGERLAYCKRLRQTIEKDTCRVRAVNPARFHLAPHISLGSFGGQGVEFITYDAVLQTWQLIIIKESSIAEAFDDYITHLHESNLIFDKEETLKIIDQYIDQYKNLLNDL